MLPVVGVAGVVALGLLAGCSTATAPTDSAAPSDPPTGTASASPAAPSPVPIPDTAVGRQVRWVVAQLERADESAPLTTHFTPEFLANVNEVQILSLFLQLRAQGPYTPTDYQGDASRASASLVNPRGGRLELTAEVDRTGKLSTLFLRPSTEVPPLDDWNAFDKTLSDTGADVAALAADVIDDRCEPRHAVNADQTMPTASAFKLYVLGAVADAVAAGRVHWDQQMTVTDAVRSLPSGRLQDAPNGTRVSVRDAALGMISISDNTATDLLMATVGRPAVEQQQSVMSHHDPAQNLPFPTTRELFQVAWGTPDRRPAWREADEAGRRRLLWPASRRES